MMDRQAGAGLTGTIPGMMTSEVVWSGCIEVLSLGDGP